VQQNEVLADLGIPANINNIMNIIIPMAGMGKRLRPHTLTTPKPLLPIAGKPIVERLINELIRNFGEKINEIGFIIGDFGKVVEKQLLNLAESFNAKGKIFYQHEALGTAHAIYCAEPILKGNVIVAFADTIFYGNIKIDKDCDAIILVKEVDDPSSFGVVKTDKSNFITDFIEKPKTSISNKAIIGIYYFNEGEYLKNEIKYLLDNNIKGNNEYQLTDALENLRLAKYKFKPGVIDEWLDCGNKDATVYTNSRVLEKNRNEFLKNRNCNVINSKIIEPCYLGNNVIIENSTIGPYVSIEDNTTIKMSEISDTIIYSNSYINNFDLKNSIIGNYVSIDNKNHELSIGDYSVIK